MFAMRLGASPKVPNSHVNEIRIILFVFFTLLALKTTYYYISTLFFFFFSLNPPIVNALSFVSLILLLSHSHLPTHPPSLILIPYQLDLQLLISLVTQFQIFS